MSENYLFRSDCYVCNNKKNKFFDHARLLKEWETDPNHAVNRLIGDSEIKAWSDRGSSDSDDSCDSDNSQRSSHSNRKRHKTKKYTHYYKKLSFLNLDIDLGPLLPGNENFKKLFESSNISDVKEGKDIFAKIVRVYSHGNLFYFYHFSTRYSVNENHNGTLLHKSIASNLVDFINKCITVELKSNDPGVLVYLYKKYSCLGTTSEASEFFSSIASSKESARAAFMMYMIEYIPS